MLFYKKKQEEGKKEKVVPNLKDYHHTHYNPQNVTKVKDLQLSDKHVEWLIDIYKQKTVDFQWKDGEGEDKEKPQKAYKFIEYYNEQIKIVCEQEQKFKPEN